LLRDEALCQQLTRNARSLVVQTYGWDVISRKLLAYFDEIDANS
jgi:glycosyltransferase involved in cell wall biosynthesis